MASEGKGAEAQARRAVTAGRLVMYALTAADAEAVNRRRTTGESIKTRLFNQTWPQGAQAHVGAEVAGDESFPMLVVRVGEGGRVNGRVFLDGTDDLWVRDVAENPVMSTQDSVGGFWHWPAQV